MSVGTPEQHEQLVQAMMDPARWASGGGQRRRIDTHISTVVLAGDRAYKIKKPLGLGFLNFLTLKDRESACHEELRLNRRLAPQIYLGVCRITGSMESPQIDGPGELLDWAVVMQRFDPDAILSQQLEKITPALIETLAEQVARFHDDAALVPQDQPFGTLESAVAPMLQNFEQIVAAAPARTDRIKPIAAWSRAQQGQLAERLALRRDQGHIRESHGDLHLGNVALIDGEAVVFDAIEFNPGLRWIDTISDVAFMTMDLKQRGAIALAFGFLNRYLQHSGDYDGVALLRFYEVYRALVRAKIAAIRIGQGGLDAAQLDAINQDLDRYLAMADALTRPPRGGVILMRGVSGSGKSYAARRLADGLAAICVRSDVERKRLLGLAQTADATGLGGYDAGVTRETYARLADATAAILDGGFVAVVDATFLRRSQREPFTALARRRGVPLVIIDCEAPVEVLEQRVLARAKHLDNVSDADLDVLAQQLETREPIGEGEADKVLTVNPSRPLDLSALKGTIG